MTLAIPEKLSASCSEEPDSSAWLDRLPAMVEHVLEAWSLTLAGPPMDGEEVELRLGRPGYAG